MKAPEPIEGVVLMGAGGAARFPIGEKLRDCGCPTGKKSLGGAGPRDPEVGAVGGL